MFPPTHEELDHRPVEWKRYWKYALINLVVCSLFFLLLILIASYAEVYRIIEQ